MSYHRFEGVARHAFCSSWFTFSRLWSGRLFIFTVKHHQITLDFRGNWLEDMAPATVAAWRARRSTGTEAK